MAVLLPRQKALLASPRQQYPHLFPAGVRAGLIEMTVTRWILELVLVETCCCILKVLAVVQRLQKETFGVTEVMMEKEFFK